MKINGIRIEPAEIEAIPRAEPAVTDAAVVAHTDERGVALHDVVTSAVSDHPALTEAQRRRLAATLPMAARPSRLTVLARLPNLPGGKVDLMALSRWPAG